MKLLVGILMSVTFAATAGAQAPVVTAASPVTDMINRAKDHLNNLKYEEARFAIRQVFELGKLRRAQEIAALQVASAVFYPEDPAARVPDSASAYLRRLVRLVPADPLPSDLAIAGLDSQLAIARREVFGAAINPPLEITLNGPEERPAIDVISTRAARWQLYMVPRQGGAAILLDTLGASTGGKLSLRAHNGAEPIIPPGSYELRVLSISVTEPDTILLRVDASAAGSVPTLVDIPHPPDSSQLLPERASRARGPGLAAAIIAGGATFALANSLKPPGALQENSSDSRGTSIAIGIGSGALLAGFLDRGRPIAANIKANSELRKNYMKRLADATATNRKRVGEYKLAITINPEIK